MSQQINLFNPIFRKKGFSFTSAVAIGYGLGIALAATAAVAVYEDNLLRSVQTQSQAVEQAFKETNARRDQLTAEVSKQKPNAQLETEISKLDVQLAGRQEVIDTVKGGAVGNTSGFSDYMRAFSRQSVDGLWLTGFDIALAGHELAIQGRALSADLVANYIKQLNQEQVMQGRQFAAMRISQPPPEPAAAVKGDSGQKSAPDATAQKDAKEQKAVLPRYLDFSVSTVELAENPKVGSSGTELIPRPLLGFVIPGAVLDAPKASVTPEGAK
jgi:hypothetical protein